jgi:vancomycin permeability regulator SanA
MQLLIAMEAENGRVVDKYIMCKPKKIFIIILAIIIIHVIYSAFSISSYGDVDETRKADAAIVLGAGVWGNKPSPVFKERINHGIIPSTRGIFLCWI